MPSPNRFSAVLAGAALVLAAVFLPGCSRDRIGEEARRGLAHDPYPTAPEQVAPEIRVLIFPETLLPSVREGFEKRYGVKVVVDTFTTEAQAHELVAGNPSKWDVVMLTQYMGNRLRGEGLLQPVPRLNPSIYQSIDRSMSDPQADPRMHYFVPFDYSALGISFNVNYLGGFPKRWEYLSEHSRISLLYGRILMPDDMRYALGVAMLYLGIDPERAGPADIAAARDLLIGNVENLGLRFASDAEIGDEMTRGSALMAITWSGGAGAILRARAECRFLIPEGRTIVTSDGLCIPRGSSKAPTAALFIEYMLHPYNSLLMANACMYASSNTRSMRYADRFLVNGPSCMFPPPKARIHLQPAEGATLDLYREAWAQVKAATFDPSKIELLPVE